MRTTLETYLRFCREAGGLMPETQAKLVEAALAAWNLVQCIEASGIRENSPAWKLKQALNELPIYTE